jgi:hypothetical protein
MTGGAQRRRTDAMNADLEALTLDVTRRAGRLAGSAEAAAALESLGLGDDRARAMNRANLFRLASDLFEEQDRSPAAQDARSDVESERRRARAGAHGAGPRTAARAVAVAVPVTASLAAIPILTGSLWNGGPAAIDRATAVGIAAATSLPVASGFVLAMLARAGNAHRRRKALGPAVAGVVVAALFGLLLWAVLTARALVAPTEVGIALQYFALLSALWLAAGLAMAAGRPAWVTIAYVAGAGVAGALRIAGGASLVAAQRTGILAAVLIMAMAAGWPSRRGSPGVPTVRLRVGSRLRTSGPLVLFGAAFTALLLVGRTAAWYSQSPPHPFILALQPDVEAGWGMAVAAMLGAIAVAVAAGWGFGEMLDAVADRTPLTAAHLMSAEALGARRRALIRLVIAAIAGAAVTIVIVLGLTAASTSFSNVVTRDTAVVFAIVSLGLVVAVWATFDAAILFAMGRSGAPVAGAFGGLSLATIVAVLLARHAAGWTAAFGLDAGAVVAWVVIGAAVRRMLRAPDVAFATRPGAFRGGAGAIP